MKHGLNHLQSVRSVSPPLPGRNGRTATHRCSRLGEFGIQVQLVGGCRCDVCRRSRLAYQSRLSMSSQGQPSLRGGRKFFLFQSDSCNTLLSLYPHSPSSPVHLVRESQPKLNPKRGASSHEESSWTGHPLISMWLLTQCRCRQRF